MPRTLLLNLSFLAIALGFAEEKNLAPHVHGEGKMSFVLDHASNKGEVSFDFPAMQVLGFEHKPKNATEKKKLAESQQLLKNPQNVFALLLSKDSKGGCVFGPSKLIVPYTASHDHGHGDHKSDHKGHDHAEHADFELSYKFECKNIKAIEGFRIEAFKKLQGLEKLKVEGLVGEKAIAQELTSQSMEFKF